MLSKVADDGGRRRCPTRRSRPRSPAGRERYAGDARLPAYFDSERGRSFIRSTLRRSRVVERLIDEWLAAHPEHPPLPHLEDVPGVGDRPSDHDHGRRPRPATTATTTGRPTTADDDAAVTAG